MRKIKSISILLIAIIANSYIGFSQSPIIGTFSPNTGSIGTLVTVNGSNLNSPLVFTIGGSSAIIVSNSGTQIVAMVMPGAVTGAITITTAGGSTSSGSNFSIIASKPPFVQQGNKLFGSGGLGNSIYQGWATALSADGNTAIVGGPFDKGGPGAAWIFTRAGGVWSQQGLKIAGSDSTGDPYQGWSVAVSANGNTALIGGPFDSGGRGATWVFNRSGSTWTQQGSKLVGTGGIGATIYQGYSVSLSADGNTAMIGGPYDNNFVGAAWFFKRSGTTWTQQGTKLTGTGSSGIASLGWSVALSADGKTGLAGGYYDNNNIGATWVFANNGTTWNQQGSKLVGSASVGSAVFQGYSVALSADGNTALIGGPNDNNSIGASWVFARSGNSWTQQGSKLIGSGYSGSSISQGNSVTLSADGNTALVGGNYDDGNEGATWVFTRSGSAWSQKGNKLKGSGNQGAAQQGYAVSISANGNDAIIGGYSDNSFKGASWIFIPASGNANLSNLTISAGTLIPVFASATLTYSASVANATSALTVTPTVSEANATVEVRVNNGTFSPVASGSPSSPLSLNVGNNIIEVLVTAQDGNTNQTYSITVSRACPGLSALLSGTASICAGAATNLSVGITGGVSPFTVVYSGGTLNNYVSGTSIPISPSGTTTYTLTSVTDANNCSAAVSGTPTVTIKANVAIVSATAANNPICPGTTTTLTANGVAGTNALVTWWTGTGGTGTNLGTGPTLPNSGPGTYFARVTGDCGNPAEATVTVGSNPVPSVSDKTTVTCSGVAFSINPSGVPGGTVYSWTSPSYNGSISGGSSQSGQTSISQVLINNGASTGMATYTVTPSIGSCVGSSFTATVTVYPSPAPTFTISPSPATCAGNNVIYTTQPGMSGYIWNVPGAAATDYNIAAGGIGSTSNSVTIKWLTAGTKNVTVNYTDANTCTSTSPATSTTTVSIGSSPSVSIMVTAGTNPTCINSSITFSAIPVNGGSTPSYQWYKNGNADPSGTNATYTVSGITNGNTPAIYVVMTATTGSCVTTPTATSATTNISIVGNSWTGSYNNQWGDARNWCAGAVPTGGSDILIPVTSRNPLISANTSIRNINIAAGASVTMSNSTLTVNGIVEGTGTFGGVVLSGLTLNGSGNIGTLYFASGGVGILKFTGAGSSATLGNPADVYYELNLGSSTLNTNGLLTLKSSVSGTAFLAPILGSGAITGDVLIERYIPQNAFRAWRLLSVPVKGAQTFKQAWQENQAPMVNGIPGYGTLLTNTTGAGGYDAATAGNSLLQFTNGAPGSFSPVNSTNSPMQTISGYFIYIRGDRSASTSGSVFSPTATTLRTKGQLYTGTQPAINLPAGQNVMIGNVFAAPIDFDLLIKSGVRAFKVWDPKLQGTFNVGAYQTFSALNGYDPIPGGGSYGSTANSRIESGQAFLVSSSSGGSIQLTESAKTTGSKNVFRTPSTSHLQQFKTRLIALTPNGDQLADGNSVVFDDSYSNGREDGDVIKAINFGENLGLYKNGTSLVIQGRRKIENEDTVQFQISNLKKQHYSFEFIPKNMDANVTAYLYDQHDGSKTPISVTDVTKVGFSVKEDPAYFATDRFKVVFKNKAAQSISLMAYKNGNGVKVDWSVSNEKRILFYEIEHSKDGVTFTTVGKTGAMAKGEPEWKYTWLHEKPEIGDNYYRVKSLSINGGYRYTATAIVAIEDGNGFNIYPNPVVNNLVNVHFTGQDAADYNVRLITSDGRQIFNKAISHNGGSATYILKLPSAITAGTYQLEIFEGKAIRSTQSLLISKN